MLHGLGCHSEGHEHSSESSNQGIGLKFRSLLVDFGCVQWLAAPTHDAGRLLEVMISRSDDDQLNPEVINVGLSDHRLVRAYIDLYETRTSRVWQKFDINAFCRDLNDSILCTDEEHTSADSTVLVVTYNKILSELLDKHAPANTTMRRPRKSDVWFDNDCQQMKKVMLSWERRYKLGRPGANREIWLAAQNNNFKTVRQKKSTFWQDRINSVRQSMTTV